MSAPRLQAEFFVGSDGRAFPRSPPLKRSEAFAFFEASRKVCARCGDRVKFGGVNVSPFQLIAGGQIDHIFPRSRGGQNNPENLQVLCVSCNASKGAR